MPQDESDARIDHYTKGGISRQYQHVVVAFSTPPKPCVKLPEGRLVNESFHASI